MISVNTHEAKTKLSALLAAVELRNETILICRNGKPVAELKAPTIRTIPDPLQTDPALKALFADGFNAMEPATAEDWPPNCR